MVWILHLPIRRNVLDWLTSWRNFLGELRTPAQVQYNSRTVYEVAFLLLFILEFCWRWVRARVGSVGGGRNSVDKKQTSCLDGSSFLPRLDPPAVHTARLARVCLLCVYSNLAAVNCGVTKTKQHTLRLLIVTSQTFSYLVRVTNLILYRYDSNSSDFITRV